MTSCFCYASLIFIGLFLGGVLISIHIAICDDNPDDCSIMSRALLSYDSTFQIAEYSDGESLLEDCLCPKMPFDLIFMDIYMPGMNGLTTVGKIRNHSKDAKIVFVSSSKDHYPEAYSLFAFNYILKPIRQEQVDSVLEQACSNIFRERRQQLNFDYKNVHYRIYTRDIQYIESRNKVICFHMADGTELLCYKKLDEVLSQLPGSIFVRCHQSFAVNFIYLSRFEKNCLSIDAVSINVSRRYIADVKAKYVTFLFNHMNREVKK
ncbi:MAG: LytR/AlgR family response regulator transcription factor [Saccharofermentanales bacterium]